MSDRTKPLTRAELLAKIDLPALLAADGHSVHETKGKLWTSIRNEKTPSAILHPPDTGAPFWRWKDFGSGKGGTAIDYVVETRGVSAADAFRILREIANVAIPPAKTSPMPSRQPQQRERIWPELREMTVREMKQIARIRGVREEAVLLAANHGLLKSGINRERGNRPAWWIVGPGFVQAKTYTGEPWDGKKMKVDSYGAVAGKWISCGATEHARKIILVEGPVGLIEGIEAVLRADEESGAWQNAGILASYNSETDLSHDQCRYLAKRPTLIIGDTGESGSKASERWRWQIEQAGGRDVTVTHAPDGDLGTLLKATPKCPPTLLQFLMNTNPS
jgi:hypothetical protein